MSFWLINKAIITYDDKTIDTNEINNYVKKHNLCIHKRSLTSRVDVYNEKPLGQFYNEEIIPIEIEIINYEDEPATGILIRTDSSGGEVKAIEIVDNIPEGLSFIDHTVIFLKNEQAIYLEKIDSISSYNNGDYSYLIDNNTIKLYIPYIDSKSDATITFKVINDGTILPGESVSNIAAADYNENPAIDPRGRHIPSESELFTIRNNASDLVIVKEAPSAADNEEVFTYTITVINQSGITQSDLAVTDKLPSMFNVLEKTIVVTKGNLVLQNGTDYIMNIANGTLTISGVNANELELNVGEELIIEVSGYVSL